MFGGSLSSMHAAKICKVCDLCVYYSLCVFQVCIVCPIKKKLSLCSSLPKTDASNQIAAF